jgi:hypothetical protein
MNTALLNRVRRLLQTTERCHVEVGRILKTVLETDGSPEFQRFTAAIPMEKRKAYFLVRIASASELKLVTGTEMRAIGWTKAARVVHLAHTRAKAKEAVAYAKTHSMPELDAFLRGEKGRNNLVNKVFHLTPAEVEELEEALLAHGAQEPTRQPMNRSAALMEIVRLVNGRSRLRAAA